MKKHATTKLRLARETLAPLTSDILDAVAGGQGDAHVGSSGLTYTLTRTLTNLPTRLSCGSVCLGQK